MYLLDANVFIQSHRAHYGFDVVPGFWEWLARGGGAGTLASVRVIKDELDVGQDELTGWAVDHASLFLAMDAAAQPSLAHLARWATSTSTGYTQAAQAEFLASGDYQLVAYAHAYNHTVVTYEVPAPGSKKKIKIPDACRALDVPCTGPYAMLREESARFVLGSSA